MARSLYICYFGVREPLVQTQVLPYLRELRKDGHSISLLTFEPGESENGKSADEIKTELSEQGIHWTPLTYHKWPSAIATAWDVFCGTWYIWRRIAKFDILHGRVHVPMLMGALARKFSRYKPKLLFDIRGFFPEEYVDAGVWEKDSTMFRTAKRIERWLMKESNAFVVLTEKAKDILFGQGETNIRPVEVIPCCVDLNRFADANAGSRADMRSRLGIGDRTVLAYVGAFGGWYLTDELAEMFAAFKSSRPDGFAMILTQSRPEMIEPKLLEHGFSSEDLLITKVDSKDIPRYLGAADIAISFIKACYSKQASSPTKNAEYLACGLPIIANTGVGDVDELLKRNRIGALVDEFTTEGYLSALREVDELGDVRERGREVARSEFDLETVGGLRYRRLYRRLLGDEQ